MGSRIRRGIDLHLLDQTFDPNHAELRPCCFALRGQARARGADVDKPGNGTPRDFGVWQRREREWWEDARGAALLDAGLCAREGRFEIYLVDGAGVRR